MAGPTSPSTLQRWSAATLTAVVLGFSAAAMWTSAEAHRARADRDLARAGSRLATDVVVSVHAAMGEVRELARAVVAAGRPDVLASLEGRVGATGVTGSEWVPAPGPPSPDSPLAGALDTARDTGRMTLTAPIGDGGPAVVVPVYRSTTRGFVLTPIAGAGVHRRDLLAGWVVGRLDLATVVADAHPEGTVVELRDGDALLAAAGGGARHRSTELALRLPGRSWVLELGWTSSPGWGGQAWTVAILGLAAAAATHMVTRGLLRGWRRASAHEAGLASDIELHQRVAPVVQHSLELAEVLPAVAVLIADHFELAGMVATAEDHAGAPTQIFALGADPDRAVPPGPMPATLPAGATAVVPLERAGRAVGALRIVAGRDLSTGELASLWVVSQYLTAAIVNARLYEQQQQAVADLERLDGLKTIFLGTASHELRTPVTAISGFARLLSREWAAMDDDQRQLFIERIHANAASLDSLVQDLLDFSRLEQGQVRIDPRHLDLGQVAGAVLDRLHPVLAEHRLERALAPGVVVQGDSTGVERIITNLISNAVKFSPVGSKVRVSVEPGPQGGGSVIVDDGGPGVPAGQRDLIFSRFYRGSEAAVVRTRGVGIGLAIVKEFVDQMGGTIQVGESPLGGARFAVTLPAPAATAARPGGEERAES